jgi:starvation-inducible DNA-binding protein
MKETNMNELEASLKVSLANTFVMYFKTHGYHWNVEGIQFSQYHEFFGDLYEDLYGAVDPLAENLRKLGAYAPKSLSELFDATTIRENQSIVGNNLKDMLNSLEADNKEVINSLNKTFALATKADKQGLADYISGRIDTHEKHAWMLTASLKGV